MLILKSENNGRVHTVSPFNCSIRYQNEIPWTKKFAVCGTKFCPVCFFNPEKGCTRVVYIAVVLISWKRIQDINCITQIICEGWF